MQEIGGFEAKNKLGALLDGVERAKKYRHCVRPDCRVRRVGSGALAAGKLSMF